MKYLRIGDMPHADTLNLIFAADPALRWQLRDAAEPVLAEPVSADHWIALFSGLQIEGYSEAPVLRRLKRDDRPSGGWRHFPMDQPRQGPVHEAERFGVPLTLPDFAQLPTLSCETLWQAGESRTLKQRVAVAARYLRVLAWFPALHALATPVARLEKCFVDQWSRSGDVSDALYQAAMTLAMGAGYYLVSGAAKHCELPPELKPQQVLAFPSAAAVAAVVQCLDDFVQKCEYEIGDSERVDEAFLKGLGEHFDLGKSVFCRLQTGQRPGPLDDPKSWKGMRWVTLLLR